MRTRKLLSEMVDDEHGDSLTITEADVLLDEPEYYWDPRVKKWFSTPDPDPA